MKARQLAQADGWVCWLCEGPVDPDLPSNARWAGTVDHVVPRSRGGRSERTNLRLAHRECNARRADALPELQWPPDLFAIDAADLWTVIARIHRRPGSTELAAVFPSAELARRASTWAVDQACAFVGGEWQGWVEPTGAGATHVVRLSATGVADPGRPKITNSSTRSRTRRRRR